MLCGSNLIVTGFSRNAQLPQLFVHILHVCTNSLTDASEVVILQLLALGGHRAEQSSSGIYQILSL